MGTLIEKDIVCSLIWGKTSFYSIRDKFEHSNRYDYRFFYDLFPEKIGKIFRARNLPQILTDTRPSRIFYIEPQIIAMIYENTNAIRH